MGNLLIDFTHNIVPTGTMYVFELLCFTWHSPTGVQGGIFSINVNCHSKSRYEFLMFLKLQYRPSRWVQLAEEMAISHFVISHFVTGVHTNLINGFPLTTASCCTRQGSSKGNCQARG